MIAAVRHLSPPQDVDREALDALERQLVHLAALSPDDAQFVLGQALDTAAALLAAHARRAAS